jgi:DNA repair protein RadD
MKSELYPDQAEAIENIRESLRGGVKRLMVQGPTGSGKTKIAAKIMDGVVAKGKRAAFVVPAIDLIDQTAQSFWAEGITDIGVIQSDHGLTDWSKPIQICSIQTIERRGSYPSADIVLHDEAHRAYKATKAWLAHPEWQHIPMIGLSATPWTRGLGKLYQSLLVTTTTQQLIDNGRLSPFTVFAAGKPDLSDVKVVKNADGENDYQQTQLSSKMQAPKLIADVVETWRSLWGKGNSLVFGVDRAHAKLIQERFEHAGVKCGYQDADTPMEERRRLRAAFHRGDLQVVSNVATLTTGVDWDVRYIALARPTKSEMLYVQIFGRGLRIAEGKDKLVFADHTQSTAELGFVTDIHHEHLDEGKVSKPGKRIVRAPKECPKCTKLKSAGSLVCDNCGYEWDVRSTIIEEEGHLRAVAAAADLKTRKAGRVEMSKMEQQVFYGELRYYATERGYKPGWAAQKFKARCDRWPPRDWESSPPCTPSPKTRSWIKSQQIAWAKSKHNGANHAR